MSEKVIELK